MKRSGFFLIFLIIVVAGIVETTWASWVPLSGDPFPLSSLPGNSLVVGDKEFSEFDFFGFAFGGAVTPTAETILIQGGQDDVTGDYGLRFVVLGFAAASNQIANGVLNFKVSVLDGYDEYYIKDVGMFLSGVSANGSGVVNVGETVVEEPFKVPVLASLSCSKQAEDGGINLYDHAEFAPAKEIWIFSKDISVSGGTNGTAHLSEFYQFYSQIPEPATIVLLCMGGLIARVRRRQRFEQQGRLFK